MNTITELAKIIKQGLFPRVQKNEQEIEKINERLKIFDLVDIKQAVKDWNDVIYKRQIIKINGKDGESAKAEDVALALKNDEEFLEYLKGKNGEDGEDYQLTDDDKKEIASLVKVPVVEKVIEKRETIIEQPIVRESVKEVAKYEEAEEIAKKLNTLKGIFSIDIIKGLRETLVQIVNSSGNTTTKAVNSFIKILNTAGVVRESAAQIKFGTGLVVTNTSDGVEVTAPGGGGGGSNVWGGMTGTLSDQTDLQTALNTKSDTTHTHTGVYEPVNANIQSHISNTSNPHSVTKTQVGLGNVDNTSDVNKPVSTTQQTALDLKQNALGYTAENSANKGISGGYASLDGSGKVPSAQLPAFVDDVLEYADLASFPGTGTTGLLYVALDTNKIYRWSGSVYIEISPSPGSTDSVTEGATNLYFTTARVLTTALTGFAVGTRVTIASTDTILQAFGKVQKYLNDLSVLAFSGSATDLTGTKTSSFISDFTTAAQTAAPAETATTEGALINGATAKTTPIDADYIGLMDSAASNVLKKLSWLNVKATLKAYFDTQYQVAGSYITATSSDTLSNKTLTAPKFADLGFIADANGNEMLIFDTVTSATNELTFKNAPNGSAPEIQVTGSSDSNVDLKLVPKGTGIVKGELKRFMVRLVASDTDQAVANAVGGDYRISNRAITIKAVGSYCDTAGTTGTYTVDINEAGTTILSTKITVDSTEKSSETAATPPVISDSSVAADAVVTFDVDAVQTTKAKGLVVWIDYVYA